MSHVEGHSSEEDQRLGEGMGGRVRGGSEEDQRPGEGMGGEGWGEVVKRIRDQVRVWEGKGEGR